MHNQQSHHTHRFTLRDLPLPAKWVLTVFLFAVGLGYVSAMVQLHFKEATPGEPLPTFADVVAHYAGSEWPIPDKNAPKEEVKEVKKAEPAAGPKVAGIKIKTLIDTRCTGCHGEGGEQAEHDLTKYDAIAKYLVPSPEKGRIHKLINGPEDAWDKDKSMTQAFFKKSEGWKDIIKERGEAAVRLERETERLAMDAWLEAGASEEAYKADAFALPVILRDKLLTQEMRTEAVETKLESAPPKKRTAKSRQISVEGLTQSTHAHLLSFALLWASTGLIFAFTSYPWWIRAAIAPIVLFAQVTDICFWWLARIDGIGPYFALGIFMTGGIVGTGLLIQIIGSLFNMYRNIGKALLAVFFIIGIAGAFVGFKYVVKPQLDAEAAGRP